MEVAAFVCLIGGFKSTTKDIDISEAAVLAKLVLS